MFSAGAGYAWTAIASKLLTDELEAGAIVAGAAWIATAAASEGLALLSEMSALQRRPATRVAPVMFAVQVLIPVLLAPLIFDESWHDTPLGGAVLAGLGRRCGRGDRDARRLALGRRRARVRAHETPDPCGGRRC